MKQIIIVLMLLCSSTMSNGQNSEKYITLKGDTYSMLVFADWVPPTGVTPEMEPRRFTMHNFEVTSYHRLPPLTVKGDRCGSVLKITEFKGCHSCLDIMRKDSISELFLATNIVCMPVNDGNIKYAMSVVTKPTRHPETKEFETLRFYNWYIQGEKNCYCISISGCSLFKEFFPKVKLLVKSLKEHDS